MSHTCTRSWLAPRPPRYQTTDKINLTTNMRSTSFMLGKPLHMQRTHTRHSHSSPTPSPPSGKTLMPSPHHGTSSGRLPRLAQPFQEPAPTCTLAQATLTSGTGHWGHWSTHRLVTFFSWFIYLARPWDWTAAMTPRSQQPAGHMATTSTPPLPPSLLQAHTTPQTHHAGPQDTTAHPRHQTRHTKTVTILTNVTQKLPYCSLLFLQPFAIFMEILLFYDFFVIFLVFLTKIISSGVWY